MPEITTITSESLQAEVRRLLPSQRGFGQDLEAQNVIVPIIDLTATAEGSVLRADLQSAVSYGSVTTALRTTAGSTTVLNSPGFYKYQAELAILTDNTQDTYTVAIRLDNTLGSAKNIHLITNSGDASGQEPQQITVNGIIYLDTNDSLVVTTIGNDSYVAIAAWPIADANGNLINPSGFSFE